MKTAIITSDSYQDHDTGPGHPEQIARVKIINENLRKIKNKNILWKKPSIIADEIIQDTHDANYLNLVKNSFPKKAILLSTVIQSFPLVVKMQHSMQLDQSLQL